LEQSAANHFSALAQQTLRCWPLILNFNFSFSISICTQLTVRYSHAIANALTLHVTSDKTLLLQILAQRQHASAYIFNQQKQPFIVQLFFKLQFCKHTTVDKSFIV